MDKIKTDRLNSLLANAFLGIFSTFFFLILLELVARLFMHSPVSGVFYETTEYVHQARPYVMFTGRPNFGPYNELGYPGPLPELKKTENEFRIFIIGGSTVLGNITESKEVRIEDAFPYLLQDHFNSAGMKNVKVFNFGVSSSVSRQDVARLVFDISPYKPDLVLMYGFGNDFYSSDPRVNYPHRFLFYELNPGQKIEPEFSDLVHILFQNSKFLRYFFSQQINDYYFDLVKKNFPQKGENQPQLRLEAIIDNIKLADHFCASICCKLIPIHQPLLAFKKNLTEDESKMIKKEDNPEFIRKQKETLFSLANKEGIRIVDFSNIFDANKDEIYEDFIHVNATGKKAVAEELFRALAPHISSWQKQYQTCKRLELKPVTHFF